MDYKSFLNIMNKPSHPALPLPLDGGGKGGGGFWDNFFATLGLNGRS